MTTQPCASADDWWHSLSPDRRNQIHRWVDPPIGQPATPGQYELPLPPLEDC